MTELSELMARARARQADVGGFDPDDLIEVDEGGVLISKSLQASEE